MTYHIQIDRNDGRGWTADGWIGLEEPVSERDVEMCLSHLRRMYDDCVFRAVEDEPEATEDEPEATE